MFLSFLTVLLLCVAQQVSCQLEYDTYKVWKVTAQNFKEISAQHSPLYLFLHQPGCKHSEDYKQRFARLAIELQQEGKEIAMGIVYCDKEYELSSTFGATNFPTLVSVDGKTHTIVDEIGFLYQLNAAPPTNDQKWQTNQIVRWLEEEPYWFAVILEEEGIEVPEEEKVKRERVMYLQPSTLYSTLLNLSNHRTGCWIYKNIPDEASGVKKYSCGSGGDPAAIESAIAQYLQGSLRQYTFQEEFNAGVRYSNEQVIGLLLQSLSTEQLEKLLKKPASQPTLLLFDAKWCPYCSGAARGVSDALDILKLDSSNRIKIDRFKRYLIDNNEIPRQKIVTKLPYLQFWWNGTKHAYEGRFDGISISNYIKSVSAAGRNASSERKQQKPSATEEQPHQEAQL